MHPSGDRATDERTNIVVDENASPAAPFRPYHILALLPTLGLLGGVTFANRVEPYVLGLPFLLFWVVMWVVATSLIMALITALDAGQPDDAGDVHTTTVPGNPTVSAAATVGKTPR